MNVLRKQINYELTEEEIEKFQNFHYECDSIQEALRDDVNEEEKDETFNTILEYLYNIMYDIHKFLNYMDVDLDWRTPHELKPRFMGIFLRLPHL